MLSTLITGAMRMRVTLWAIDMVLPSGATLQPRLERALLGIMAAAAGGALTVLAVATLIVGGAFELMQQEYLTPAQAALMVTLSFITLIVTLVWYARRQFRLATRLPGQAAHKTKDHHTPDPIKELIDGFIEGLTRPVALQTPASPSAETASGAAVPAQKPSLRMVKKAV